MTAVATGAAFVVAAALGTLARAEIGRRFNRGFPWGTWIVNVSGAAALGALSGIAPPWATVLGTGALGAYTTFSSFARDITALVEQRRAAAAVGYVGATLVAGIGAAWMALALVG